MALTTEEKLARLHIHPEWIECTPQQQKALEKFAETSRCRESYAFAYPSARAGSTNSYANAFFGQAKIKRLVSAMLDEDDGRGLVEREDALLMLSKHLRNPNENTDQFCKVLSLYSKMMGWDKQPAPGGEDAEQDLNEMVKAAEKKRKETTEE